MKVFQYVVVKNPSKKKLDSGEKSRIIVDLSTIVASDENTAAGIAYRSIPSEHEEALEKGELQVVIRPF